MKSSVDLVLMVMARCYLLIKLYVCVRAFMHVCFREFESTFYTYHVRVHDCIMIFYGLCLQSSSLHRDTPHKDTMARPSCSLKPKTRRSAVMAQSQNGQLLSCLSRDTLWLYGDKGWTNWALSKWWKDWNNDDWDYFPYNDYGPYIVYVYSMFLLQPVASSAKFAPHMVDIQF